MKKIKNLTLFVVVGMTILITQSCATPNVACPKWTETIQYEESIECLTVDLQNTDEC